jgi:ATPase subunit of ABC transporter with duplicated ATPase domains
MWEHPHLLVPEEVTTHLDFYTVQGLSRALLAFNSALVIVTHGRFLAKSLIEIKAKVLKLDDGNSVDVEKEEQGELKQRSLPHKGRQAASTRPRGARLRAELRFERRQVCLILDV